MSILTIKRSLPIIVAVFAVALVLPATLAVRNVGAHGEAGGDDHPHEVAPTAAQENREAARGRLDDARLRACENRQKAIANIMARLSDRGQKQTELFTAIAERTQQFYVSTGRSVANYDALVADVAAKRTAAQAAVSAVTDTGAKFACDTEDPKATATVFRDSLRAEIDALKAYKTAVKNLIVGVRSAQGQAASADNGGTQ